MIHAIVKETAVQPFQNLFNTDRESYTSRYLITCSSNLNLIHLLA